MKHSSSLVWNKDGIINLLIVSAIMLLTFLSIHGRAAGSANPDFFKLILAFDFVCALWISWYMPTYRVIALTLIGALVGLFTEGTASYARLWVYENGIGIEAGICIYALTAVALFGLVYLINRVLSLHRFARTTGWLNCLIVVLIFLALLILLHHETEYFARAVRCPGVLIYYGIMFMIAVTFAFAMRLGNLLSVIFAAMLVSLVGQYSGGIQAQIWTFLPGITPVKFPPLYLIFTFWSMEYIVEYGLSSMIADGLTLVFKVRKRQRIEDGLAPEEESADVYFQPDSPIPEKDRIKIPFFDPQPHDEKCIARLMRISRRSFMKMLSKTPENGEIITVVAGLLMLTCAVFEKAFNAYGWERAFATAGIFGLALYFSPKLFWKRVAGMAFTGAVVGYGIFAGLKIALDLAPPVHNYFGNFFWAPFSFLAVLVIYGATHILTQFLARIFPSDSDTQDQGEPRNAVAVSAAILSLILLAIFIIRPGVFSGSMIQAAGVESLYRTNPFLLLFTTAVILAFSIWWFFPLISRKHLFIHAITAFLLSLFMLLILPWQWKSGIAVVDGFLLAAGAMSLVYFFSYLASASISAEPLVKGIRKTYWRKPKKVTPAVSLNVVFHDSPHPEGRHRMRENGAFHTYPSPKSGVNVTTDKPDNPEGDPLPIEEVARRTLDGLVGCWPAADPAGGFVDCVRDAVRGKVVFIKPNIVVPCGSPYTTSPELVAAVARYCLDAGADRVRIGEIAISNITSRMVLVATGLKDYWESIDPRVSVELLDEESFYWINLSDDPDNHVKGVVFGGFFMPRAMCEENTFYIDMPKMKTHLQSSVTLGIKNSHGLVAECDRGRSHQRISQKVVDITKVWIPDLTIEDGYDALEGIGPWPGELVPLRALVASNDVVLADLVASQLMQKEQIEPNYARPVDFETRFVKSTWLGHEQGLGRIDPGPDGYGVTRTRGADRTPVEPGIWNGYIKGISLPFKDPEFRDEGLIKNIGARFGKYPDFNPPPGPYRAERDYGREYLPLDKPDPPVPCQSPLEVTSMWGPMQLVADEWRNPHVGASVMFSGVFGLLKSLLERYFSRELDILDGFAVVYGPLRKPLQCEGAILFGDGAIGTEYLVFAPRIYHLAGRGKPPNAYSDTIERIAEELGGKLLGFSTEAVTISRGWYW